MNKIIKCGLSVVLATVIAAGLFFVPVDGLTIKSEARNPVSKTPQELYGMNCVFNGSVGVVTWNVNYNNNPDFQIMVFATPYQDEIAGKKGRRIAYGAPNSGTVIMASQGSYIMNDLVPGEEYWIMLYTFPMYGWSGDDSAVYQVDWNNHVYTSWETYNDMDGYFIYLTAAAYPGSVMATKGVTTMPKGVVESLKKNPYVAVEMNFDYNGISRRVVIPAGCVIDLGYDWYGPELLLGLYGDAGPGHYINNASNANSWAVNNPAGVTVPTAPVGGYVVKKGDTLSKIAKSFNTTLPVILAKNPQIKNANIIIPGQIINI